MSKIRFSVFRRLSSSFIAFIGGTTVPQGYLLRGSVVALGQRNSERARRARFYVIDSSAQIDITCGDVDLFLNLKTAALLERGVLVRLQHDLAGRLEHIQQRAFAIIGGQRDFDVPVADSIGGDVELEIANRDCEIRTVACNRSLQVRIAADMRSVCRRLRGHGLDENLVENLAVVRHVASDERK